MGILQSLMYVFIVSWKRNKYFSTKAYLIRASKSHASKCPTEDRIDPRSKYAIMEYGCDSSLWIEISAPMTKMSQYKIFHLRASCVHKHTIIISVQYARMMIM